MFIQTEWGIKKSHWNLHIVHKKQLDNYILKHAFVSVCSLYWPRAPTQMGCRYALTVMQSCPHRWRGREASETPDRPHSSEYQHTRILCSKHFRTNPLNRFAICTCHISAQKSPSASAPIASWLVCRHSVQLCSRWPEFESHLVFFCCSRSPFSPPNAFLSSLYCPIWIKA